MLRKFYQCIIYTFIRGYISKGYNDFDFCPYIIDVKRMLDSYSNCWLYKILKHII